MPSQIDIEQSHILFDYVRGAKAFSRAGEDGHNPMTASEAANACAAAETAINKFQAGLEPTLDVASVVRAFEKFETYLRDSIYSSRFKDTSEEFEKRKRNAIAALAYFQGELP